MRLLLPRNASACEPPCGVVFTSVMLSRVKSEASTPNAARALTLGLMLLLFEYCRTEPARSSPRTVMNGLFEGTYVIPVYAPGRTVITIGCVLLAGTKSTAPCTVQKSPPSNATVTALDPAAGPLVCAGKVHKLTLGKPAKGAPLASTITPGSMVTE